MLMRSFSKFLAPIFTFLMGSYLTTIFYLETCSQESKPSPAQNNKEYLLFVLILSAPINQDQRDVMRQTWLKPKPYYDADQDLIDSVNTPIYQIDGFLEPESLNDQQDNFDVYMKSFRNFRKNTSKVPSKRKVRFIHRFMIGTGTMSDSDKWKVDDEQNKYQDLWIMEDHEESYDLLTDKLLRSIKRIVAKYNFKYLLKCDDDTFVELDKIIRELVVYDDKISTTNFEPNPVPWLYWGYFNGKASIKEHGKWTEWNFNLCSHYLPYALGGGYILSQPAAKYIADNGEYLSAYISEDVSVGTWLSPFRHVYRKHDVRFDTGWTPRKCQPYKLVVHKCSLNMMRDFHRGKYCSYISANLSAISKPKTYLYNWRQSPLGCCNHIFNEDVWYIFAPFFLIKIN